MDRDSWFALEAREKIAREVPEFILAKGRGDEADPVTIRQIELVWANRIYVWESDAHISCHIFWQKAENREAFESACFVDGRPRYLPGLLERTFLFFPTGEEPFARSLPRDVEDTWCARVFPPQLRSIALRTYEEGGEPRLWAVFESDYLDPEKSPSSHAERRAFSERLSRLPQRDLAFEPCFSSYQQIRYAKVRGGCVSDKYPLDWLLKVYQLRLFLEQPFVGLRAFRRKSKHSDKLGAQREEEILTAYMREPFNKRIPVFQLPGISRVTGHGLEFEVDVREHTRHCASGTVTKVKAHKRGPIGVTRERIIKVI